MNARNGTWKYITGALALFLLCTGTMWGMIDAHAVHPHASAVPRPEFTLLKDSMERQLARIETKLDEALRKK